MPKSHSVPQPAKVEVQVTLPQTLPTQETTLATTVTDIEVLDKLEEVRQEIIKNRVVTAVGLDTDINPESDELEEAQEE